MARRKTIDSSFLLLPEHNPHVYAIEKSTIGWKNIGTCRHLFNDSAEKQMNFDRQKRSLTGRNRLFSWEDLSSLHSIGFRSERRERNRFVCRVVRESFFFDGLDQRSSTVLVFDAKQDARSSFSL